MKKQILLVVSLIFSVQVSAFAQTKTVTNSDLESFRQKRLEAERDYKENYEKLGFPSPKELEAQIAEDRRQLEDLSSRLRSERLEREKVEALDAQLDALDTPNVYIRNQNNNYTRFRQNNYNNYPSFGIYYYRVPKFRSRYNRPYRNNNVPPIRPPQPIRPPRGF